MNSLSTKAYIVDCLLLIGVVGALASDAVVLCNSAVRYYYK